MSELVQIAIESVAKSRVAFCKFISANDAGVTGAHQEGLYIPKNSISLMFDEPGIKGENKDRFITIKWQNEFETNSRFIYYGRGTRNEYRLTRFGRGFPFLTDDNVGNLFILSHIEEDYYEGFVLSADEDIDDFLASYNISSNETNRLIQKASIITSEGLLSECFLKFIHALKVSFPPTYQLAENARMCYNVAFKVNQKHIQQNPDSILLNWIDTEFQLFKAIENERYNDRIKTPFPSVEELITFANTILNRRKSRAGKSLEHHLAEIFENFTLSFDGQAITEGNKKPDFIFPNGAAYHDISFDENKLVFLASKTTCKDRWRQILNEADRIRTKHLFTLQQGVSKNQLEEMYKAGVCLVVPSPYLHSFPKEFIGKILTLDSFIKVLMEKQQ